MPHQNIQRSPQLLKMSKYAKAVIYKVNSANEPNLIYYDSTTRTLEIRLDEHVRDARPEYKGKRCSSRHVIHAGAYSIHEVQPAPYSSKKELIAVERQYIEGRQCVNKNVPGRTHKELVRAYYKDNTEKIKIKQKAYREANTETLKQKKRENYLANGETQKAQVKTRSVWRRSFGYWGNNQHGTLCDIHPTLFN